MDLIRKILIRLDIDRTISLEKISRGIQKYDIFLKKIDLYSISCFMAHPFDRPSPLK